MNANGDIDISADLEAYVIKIEPEDTYEISSEYADSQSSQYNGEVSDFGGSQQLKRPLEFDPITSSHSKLSRLSVDDQARMPNGNYRQNNEASTSSGHRVPNPFAPKDPRLRKHQNGNDSGNSTITNTQRETFLNGSLSAGDLLKMKITSSDQLQLIKDIRSRVSETQKLINKESSSFYAHVPTDQLMPSGSSRQKSPIISNSHNPIFRSQATPENVREALIGQRCSNVPSALKLIAHRVGADLDAISQAIQPKTHDSTFQIQYLENTRTFHTQTDFEENAEPRRQVEKEVNGTHDRHEGAAITMSNAEVQTDKNNGVFSITIDDLSELTHEERNGLKEFKRVMARIIGHDDTSTGGILERLRHRQANSAYKEHRKSSQNSEYNNGAGPSRINEVSEFTNPPAPTSNFKKPWANARPQ